MNLRIAILMIVIFGHSTAHAKATCQQLYASILRVPPKRTPSNIKAQLKKLYPHLSMQQIESKIKSSSNFYLFYRSFVALFYDEFNRSFRLPTAFKKLEKTQGWMAGDLHPENLGIVLDKNGIAMPNISDIDDAGRGPLFLDFLRFYTGSLVINPAGKTDHSIDKIVAKYISGISNDKEPFPKVIDELIEKSKNKGRSPKKKYYDEEKKMLARSGETVEISAQLKTRLHKTCKTLFPNKTFSFEDALYIKRTTGGSAYLERYAVLLRFNEPWQSDKRRVVVEFKQSILPSIDPLNTEHRSSEIRIREAWDILQGKDKSDYLQTVSFDKKDFIVRPRFDGDVNFSYEDLNPEDMDDYLQASAYIVGQKHRAGLKLSQSDIKTYAQSLQSIAPEDWVSLGALMKSHLFEIYRILKN